MAPGNTWTDSDTLHTVILYAHSEKAMKVYIESSCTIQTHQLPPNRAAVDICRAHRMGYKRRANLCLQHATVPTILSRNGRGQIIHNVTAGTDVGIKVIPPWLRALLPGDRHPRHELPTECERRGRLSHSLPGKRGNLSKWRSIYSGMKHVQLTTTTFGDSQHAYARSGF